MCAYIWIGDIIYPWSFFTASLRDKLSWLCQQPCIWSPLIATIMVRHSTWLSYLKYIWQIRHIEKYPTMHFLEFPSIFSQWEHIQCVMILTEKFWDLWLKPALWRYFVGFMDSFHADQSFLSEKSNCHYRCLAVVCGMSHLLCVAAYNVANKNVQTTIDFSPRSLWAIFLHTYIEYESLVQLQSNCQSIIFYIDISLKVLLAPSVFLGVCNALVYAVGEWLLTWI